MSAERACEACAVKAKQLVTVGCTPRFFFGAAGGSDFDGVPTIFKSLDGPLSVMYFKDTFDVADWIVLFEPA